MLSESATTTVTGNATGGGAGTEAATRTVWPPSSSPTAVNSSPEPSANPRVITRSWMVNPAAATVTVLLFTLAEPDNATFSGAAVSSTLSARAVKSNEPDPLTDPAGIDTVN